MELAGSYYIIDMVIYCQSCGKPNSHGSSKPNFCQGCGVSLGKTKEKPHKTILSARSDDDDDSEAADVVRVPNIDRLEVEINTNPQKGIRIEDVVGTSNPEEMDEPLTPPDGVIDISTDDFMKQFQREAGALKPKR